MKLDIGAPTESKKPHAAHRGMVSVVMPGTRLRMSLAGADAAADNAMGVWFACNDTYAPDPVQPLCTFHSIS